MYTIYGRKGCIYCMRAKNILNQYKEDFLYIDLEQDDQAMNWFLDQGYKTVPQIFFSDDEMLNAYHIGGFDELKEVLENNG